MSESPSDIADAAGELALMRQRILSLAEVLVRNSPGHEVWRVAGPDGAYCLEFDRSDYLNPKADCDRWIKENPTAVAVHGYTAQKTIKHEAYECAALQLASSLRAIAEGKPA